MLKYYLKCVCPCEAHLSEPIREVVLVVSDHGVPSVHQQTPLGSLSRPEDTEPIIFYNPSKHLLSDTSRAEDGPSYRVKSVFRAPVPAYCLAQALALSAHAAWNKNKESQNRKGMNETVSYIQTIEYQH